MSGRRQITLERRRKEHQERLAAWQAMTTEQKLRVINSRPGNSTRERKRLEEVKK